ncbi:MAG: hypothetical protein GWO19_10615, partial [Nitrospinaceae bacterium]|nr:hypothetical protein [Nitrospinaceae bacterium]NIS85388.1 hypothetical protein [Nitrospinaceae bacterium]NIU96595.1 hypothetical protein [Nitrospinaceae bacterium]
RSSLERREAIAIKVLQAIICKKEVIRPSPKQAAMLAVEHTDHLLNQLARPLKRNMVLLDAWRQKPGKSPKQKPNS